MTDLRSEWCYALPSSALDRIGDQVALRIGARDLLLVRDDDEEVRALTDRCPHKGELIVEPGGPVNSARIRCNHHGWTFTLSGRLVGGPGFDLSSRETTLCLTTFRTAELHGLIVVGPDERLAPGREPPRQEDLPRLGAPVSAASETIVPSTWADAISDLTGKGHELVLANLVLVRDGAEAVLIRIEPAAGGGTAFVRQVFGPAGDES